MRIDSLSFAVSYLCDAQCAHCCVESGPKADDRVLSTDRIMAIIDRIHDRFPLRYVGFTGGEPTLFPEVVVPALEHCRNLGIPSRLVSNGRWAADRTRARAFLAQFADAGLGLLCLSMSPYHAAFVSEEQRENAIEAALHHGLDVQLQVVAPDQGEAEAEQLKAKFVPGGDGENPASNSKEPCHDPISILSGVPIPVGRGATLPAQAFPECVPPEKAVGGCGMVFNPLLIDPSGDIIACCGFPGHLIPELRLGSSKGADGPLAAVEAARRTPLLHWIRNRGPWRILETIEPGALGRAHPAGSSICQGCNLLFRDPERRAALHAYLDRRGDGLMFEECREGHAAATELSLDDGDLDE